jgi:predicted transposase/invertase (TIGR01784 family)
MLLTEWKLEEALVVEREEGREETKREDARNLLALGVSPATVAKAIGLDMETIMGLSGQGTG